MLNGFTDGKMSAMGSGHSFQLLETELGPLIDGRWIEPLVLAAILLTAILIAGAVLMIARARRREGH